ncbi:hypothetical protein F0562_003625 [Nyssa sinensis]|uniref:Uncharacterized protein n=1 Tax=Nyssa sinensis TaxID=561372 RepID=A0A5J5BW28_9ASTE|nr:hypothetical protein F0562_003625 [Nyssa sinensis]
MSPISLPSTGKLHNQRVVSVKRPPWVAFSSFIRTKDFFDLFLFLTCVAVFIFPLVGKIYNQKHNHAYE